jgi:hypothetical protein
MDIKSMVCRFPVLARVARAVWPKVIAPLVRKKTYASASAIRSCLITSGATSWVGQPSAAARFFVKTGTLLSDTTAGAAKQFKGCITIELDPALYHRAAERFRDNPAVQVLHGDNAVVLRAFVATLDEPVVFSLDGHDSGGITAHGDRDTRIEDELRAVLSQPKLMQRRCAS